MDDPIERPAKRPRLSNATAPGSETDSLDLQKARHQNDLNLKSIFENIFAKYENDFTEVGDEIDLETGELVVNNGHIGLITETSLWDPEIEEPETDGEAYAEEGDGYDLGLEERDLIENIGAGGDAVEPLEPTLVVPTRSQLHDKGDNPKDSKWNFPSFENEKAKLADPIWNAPDFGGKVSTPTFRKPPLYPTPSYHFIRSASPPGAPDIWALPRKGRPSTGGVKRYKNAGAKRKRKPRANALTTDWSFAEVSDGNDSDDPLNEEQDHLQSPTPKGIFNIRGRKAKPVARSRDDITKVEGEAADVDGSAQDKHATSSNLKERDVAEAGEEGVDTYIPSNLDPTESATGNTRDVTETGKECDATNGTSNRPDDEYNIPGTFGEESTGTNVPPNNTDDLHNTAEAGNEDAASVASIDIEEKCDASDDEMELVPMNGPTPSSQPIVAAPNEFPDLPSPNNHQPRPGKDPIQTESSMLPKAPKLTTKGENRPETYHT